MTIDQFISELDTITEVYKEYIVTRNYQKVSNSEISWPSYKTGIYKNMYVKEYETIIRSRQYSYLLSKDRGCLQFYYSMHDGVLNKIKLAYYPYPVELNTTQEDFELLYDDSDDPVLTEYYYDLWNIFNQTFELKIHDTNLKKLVSDSIAHGNNESIENLLLTNLENKYRATNTSHIRIDYDAKVESHNKCEVQIGAINKIRFPIDRIITPMIFTEFIFKNIMRPRQHQRSPLADILNTGNYRTKMSESKRLAQLIVPFNEDNMFIGHR